MEQITNYISELTATLSKLDIDSLVKLKDAFINARDNKKQIIVFGNGGSGSTASHMVCDIVKGCSYGKEKRFKMICLNDNIPTILAYSNDVSYDEVFVEQLKNFLNEGDVVLGISGSGNSINVLKAMDYAKQNKAITIGFTGFGGGKLKSMVDISIHIPINDMQITEDGHVIIMHILYKLLND